MLPTVYLISVNMAHHQNLAIPTLQAYIMSDDELKGAVNLRHMAFFLPVSPYFLFNSLMRLEPEIVGFSCYMWNIEVVLETCVMLKTVNPHITLILGGPEVGPRAEELLSGDCGIDYVIPGEGEAALTILLKHLILSSVPVEAVPGAGFRRGSKIINNPPLPLALDQIPSPYKMGFISFEPGIFYHYIEGSRGCPFACGYCISGQQKPGGYSPRRVVEDLKEIFNRQLPCIQFVDPCFNYNPQRARDIFRDIFEYNIRTNVHVALRGERIDKETIALFKSLKDKKYRIVLDIGIQAVHDRALKNISRFWQREKLTGILHELCSIPNCEVSLSLVIGLPGDTYESYKASLDFVHTFDFTYLRAIICRLIPGCSLRLNARQYGVRFNPHPPYEMIKNNTFSYFDIQRADKLTVKINEWDSLRQLYRFFSEVFGMNVSLLFEELEKWQNRNHFSGPIDQRTNFRILSGYARRNFKTDRRRLQMFFAFSIYFYFSNLHTYKTTSVKSKNSCLSLNVDSLYALSGAAVMVFLKYEAADLLIIGRGLRKVKKIRQKPNYRLFFNNGEKNIRLSKKRRSLLLNFKQPLSLVDVFNGKNQAAEKKELAFLKYCIEEGILIAIEGENDAQCDING